jgi:hypothetical protein
MVELDAEWLSTQPQQCGQVSAAYQIRNATHFRSGSERPMTRLELRHGAALWAAERRALL